MTKQEINTKLKELLQNENTGEITKEAKHLLAQYQSIVVSQHKEQLDKFVEEGGERKDFAPMRDDEDKTFDEMWAKYSQRVKSFEKQRANEQANNLKSKEAIIAEIIDLTTNEENIGKAFSRISELQEQWKTIGNVPSEKLRNLQSQYGKARDEFYYNIKIYKELLEHDLKRNLQLKEDLANKMVQLAENSNIKELEAKIKVLSSDWDEVGPTYKEKWEEVRDRFKDAQNKAYDKIRGHYKTVREQQQDNLDKKVALCEKVERMMTIEIKTEKRWRKLTDEVISIQREWKTVGFATKKENDSIWERFKKAGDDFFNAKSSFFAEIKDKQDNNKKLKKQLVEEAEALKVSENWKETSQKLITLQKKWQGIGNAHQRDEQRLWKQFRAACNAFFENKKKFYSTLDVRQEENLKLKVAVIEKIEALTPSEDVNASIDELEALSREFNAIGFVPISEKSKLTNQYRKALDNKYSEIGISQDEIHNLQFKNKLKELKASDNPDVALAREEKNIRDKIKKFESTIQQYENNLGFFANSKGADTLKKEVEGKLNKTKRMLDEWSDKLDLLYSIRNGN